MSLTRIQPSPFSLSQLRMSGWKLGKSAYPGALPLARLPYCSAPGPCTPSPACPAQLALHRSARPAQQADPRVCPPSPSPCFLSISPCPPCALRSCPFTHQRSKSRPCSGRPRTRPRPCPRPRPSRARPRPRQAIPSSRHQRTARTRAQAPEGEGRSAPARPRPSPRPRQRTACSRLRSTLAGTSACRAEVRACVPGPSRRPLTSRPRRLRGARPLASAPRAARARAFGSALAGACQELEPGARARRRAFSARELLELTPPACSPAFPPLSALVPPSPPTQSASHQPSPKPSSSTRPPSPRRSSPPRSGQAATSRPPTATRSSASSAGGCRTSCSSLTRTRS